MPDAVIQPLRLTLCLALLLLSGGAAAQVSFGAGSDTGNATLVDERVVLENASDAFRVATGERVVAAGLGDDGSQRAAEIVTRLTREFERETRLLINELKGDGLLEADEVTEEFSSLRDDYLGRLELALDALAGGFAPPPAAADYDGPLAHTRAMIGYTFMTRNDASDWLALAAAVATGLVLAWLVSFGLRKAGDALRAAGRRRTAALTEALVAPLYVAALAVALLFGFRFLWVPGMAGDMLNRGVEIALMAAVFWFLWNACETVAHGLGWLLQKTYGKSVDRHATIFVSRALRMIVLVTFLLLLVNGILDSDLTGLVAGLGIIGVALSFVLRGTIQNVAASFTIFGDQPFRVGDLIIYDDEWGRIEDIGFRSTRFRTLAGHLITIPNAQLIDNALHNVGARPSVRRRLRIGLTYDTPAEKVEQAMQILRDLLQDHRGQPANEPPRVLFEDYGDSALVLLVQYNFEPADYWKALEFDSEINLEIKRRFEEAGIDFAFPSRSVYLHASDDLALMRLERNHGEADESGARDHEAPRRLVREQRT